MGDIDTLNERLMDVQRLLVRMEAAQQAQDRHLISLDASVEELNRTVRGHNGTPGLVTDVALVREAVQKMQVVPAAIPASPKTQNDEDESNNGSRMWVIEKLFLPVVVPAITAAIIYLIFSVIPHVSQVPVP